MRQHPVQQGPQDLPLHSQVQIAFERLRLGHVVEGGGAGDLNVLLADVTLHGEEEDVERLANVLEVVVAKYLEQVVQDVLKHRRPENAGVSKILKE